MFLQALKAIGFPSYNQVLSKNTSKSIARITLFQLEKKFKNNNKISTQLVFFPTLTSYASIIFLYFFCSKLLSLS